MTISLPLNVSQFSRSGRDFVSRTFGGVSNSLFREYDIRGRVDSPSGKPDLDEFVCYRIGRAFGTFLRRRGVGSMALGFDGRQYSYSLSSAMAHGVLASGVDVVMIGLASTPLVYFAQHQLASGGCVITASHNPNGWSGLKLSDRPSHTLGPSELAELKSLVDDCDFDSGAGSLTEQSFVEEYTAHLAHLYPAEQRLRVAIDGGNGVAAPLARAALTAAGYEVHEINGDLDWSYPNHEPDPENVEARKQIAEATVGSGASVGLSFDGDGDRLGVTSDQGEIVWSDIVLALLARDVLATHPGSSIVFDVKCSRAVPQVITSSGGVPVMWKTGHSHIKSKMFEIEAPFAGERSGHFFDNADYFGYDDALAAALRLLQIISRSGRPLSALLRELPQFLSTPTMHAHCADDVKYDVVERFADFAAQIGANEVVRVNGVRAEFDDGWLLVRASSNLPALVIVIEAEDASRLKALYELTREGLGRDESVDVHWENDPF